MYVTDPKFVAVLYQNSAMSSRFQCFRVWLERMHRLLYVEYPAGSSVLQYFSPEKLAACRDLWRELPDCTRDLPSIPRNDEDVDMEVVEA